MKRNTRSSTTPFAGITLAGSTGIISALPYGKAPRETEAAFNESRAKV